MIRQKRTGGRGIRVLILALLCILAASAAAFAAEEDIQTPEDTPAAGEDIRVPGAGLAAEEDAQVPESADPAEEVPAPVPVGLQYIDGHYFYFDDQGQMLTGVINIGDVRKRLCYFDPAGQPAGAMVTGSKWMEFDGSRYYFLPQADGTSIMKTGWLISGAKRWYLNPKTGAMITGWKTISGKRYYFKKGGSDQVRGTAVTKLRTIGGNRYFFSNKGVMKKGNVTYKGKLYYFRSSGKAVMKTGWFRGSDKKKRYSLGKGRVAAGEKKIKGIWYRFSGKTGVLVRRIGDDVDRKFQSYSSSTRYMIVVKLSEHKVRIYKGKKGRWNRIRTHKCTTGAPSTPTIRGTFRIGAKGLYFNTGTAQRCWYYTQFRGNYLFHSVVYDRSSSPRNVVDGRLGISASHGCIRLSLQNAKWIYRNIPRGTKVVIY